MKRTKEDVGPIAAVTVGARNAARTATALRKKGISVTNLGKTGWKISEDLVAYMENELSQRAALDEILVLQCLDSNCFYVLEKLGAMAMPCRGDDGLVHIQGKVVVARRLQLENLLELLGPLLREREGKLTILVCPSVRFLEACCHAHEALSQEARNAEGERQLRELGSLRREVRTWLVRHGFHDVLLADPLEAAGAAKLVQRARELMYNAVHMKPAAMLHWQEGSGSLPSSGCSQGKGRENPWWSRRARGRKQTRMRAHRAARAGPRRVGRACRGATRRRGKGRVPPQRGKKTSCRVESNCAVKL